MTLDELANRLDDAVNALERIAHALETRLQPFDRRGWQDVRHVFQGPMTANVCDRCGLHVNEKVHS